ncbi:PAS domain-containing sensor histidine kinase [Microbacterium pygmaeum]|uniref:histidine kinase n=1 Tax=Microbacterium pygmaeum TaxID=370764 RepID=A0A1G8BB86_9MICO|nr:PAS domain-containing sensor histidine kinase [Microbacterium pygmaeum]SDH30489.1 PAS fold-containing protein [Microbacterium pygmaeum]
MAVPDARAAESARAPRASAPWALERRGDRTRERAAILNQVLLCAVVFVLFILVGVGPFSGDVLLFLAGVVLIFLITGATFVIPWNRLAVGWLALIPLLDMLAIGVMRLATPGGAVGLLWIFPTMWLAAGFGMLGLSAVVVVVGVDLLTAQQFTDGMLLLTVVLIAVGVTSYLSAGRAAAQRTLLGKQAFLLRRVIERTRRQEQEVTEVLDAVDFGVIRIAADGDIAVTNDAHGRLQRARRSAEDADAETTAFRDDGVTPLPDDELPLQRALRGEAFEGQVVWFGAEPGPRQALSVTVRRLTDPSGTDAGAVLVSRDVTAELSALRARDELVASVTHELRTPLTSILGYLDLAIEDPETTEQVRANLDIAERNAERLLAIVGDILAASSAASVVQASLEPGILDARDVVLAAAEALAPRAAARAISVDTSALQSAPVWADALRLRQVVDNLASNAVAYNRDGGTVFLESRTDGLSSWIVVRDTGVGMNDDELAGLFQRFYRANPARRAGTGLGLAISRDIVRAHGGEITVDSSPGIGSTFTVKLPTTSTGRPPS